jgi:pimeloyl-ACP methyl ester carboxylesterase
MRPTRGDIHRHEVGATTAHTAAPHTPETTMSTRIFLPGTRGRWIRQGNQIVLLPGEPFRPAWGEGELQGEEPGASGAKLRIVIFYGYSGAHGAGTTERDHSNQMVARTLKEHLARRFPADQIDVVCTWHKNAFVNELIASTLKIRQIHYCGHGFGGGLSMAYHNRVAETERGTLAAQLDASSATALEKRKTALVRDAALISGFFTDALPAAKLATLKANLAPGAMMQIWGCFTGAPQHTFDTADTFWNLFNAAGAPMDGIALHIAKSLGIEVTAVTDPGGIHGMNYWYRDASGTFHDSNRKSRMPHWLWPSSKKVVWVTYDASGNANKTSINFMGKATPPKDLPAGRPPKWLTGELPKSMAAKAPKAMPTCSATFVTI